jgi:hypothetical protein
VQRKFQILLGGGGGGGGAYMGILLKLMTSKLPLGFHMRGKREGGFFFLGGGGGGGGGRGGTYCYQLNCCLGKFSLPPALLSSSRLAA